jgi:hypothetical protein
MCLFKNVPVLRKICFKEVTGFLKISVSLHTRLAAVTRLAVGEFLHLAVNREDNNNKINNNIIIIIIIKVIWLEIDLIAK